jgi:hypothetical protein
MCFFALVTSLTRADMIFDNGSGNLGTSGLVGYSADGLNPSGFFAAGDVYTPTVSGTVQTITFAGFYSNSNSIATDPGGSPLLPFNNFSVYFATVNPDTTPPSLFGMSGRSFVLQVTSTILSNPSPSTYLYQFSGTLSIPFNVTAGTDYFLAIGDISSPSSGFNLDVTASPGPASDGWQLNNTSPVEWDSSLPDVSFAFSLGGTVVPEPSTWVMTLGGLFFLIFGASIRSKALAR